MLGKGDANIYWLARLKEVTLSYVRGHKYSPECMTQHKADGKELVGKIVSASFHCSYMFLLGRKGIIARCRR